MVAHFKCLDTNERGVRNGQEELDALAQSQSYDNIGISETCWEESCDWTALMDGGRLFRRERQSRQGGGVLLYVKDRLDCIAHAAEDNTVKSLCVDVMGKANRADVLARVCYGSRRQDDDTDVRFYKESREAARSVTLCRPCGRCQLPSS